MKTRRRAFLQSTVALTGGVLLGVSKSSQGKSGGISNLIKIDEPVHGAILNHRDGLKVDDGLKIIVKGEAPLRSNVTVNGMFAKREGTAFTAEIILRSNENDITARAEGWFGQNNHTVRVVWDRNSFLRYGFNIDDNIFFLRDIARKKYNSLFDSFYLKGLRDLNRKYGAKFHVNIYYTDGLEYTNEPEFDLTQFPDRYKGEWQDNANWLRLAFHAIANKPDWLYLHSGQEPLASDFDKVAEQIRRFAGEETYTPLTNMHWDGNQSAWKLLAERGVRVLSNSFVMRNGVWVLNYGMDEVRSEYLSTHQALKDFESGIVFSKVDMICNSTPIDQIEPILEQISKDDKCAEVMDLFTHEQYFWPFYVAYIPDHFERLDKTFRWVTDHGYKPVFLHEGLLGAPI